MHAALMVAVLGLVACGEETTTGQAGTGTTVAVTLTEFTVAASPSSAPAGSITFDATNEGPDDVHELVIIQTDLSATDLPTTENGSVDEEGEGITVVDEVEDIPVGDSQSVTVDLDAGNYVLICNIYDEDEQEAHYQEGMRAPFTVT
jgi:uncharacterized cupredoxin-like copper-binding protein